MSRCEYPCSTCPWLKENHGKPNPPGFSPKALTDSSPDMAYHDWYSHKNLKRLWNGLRQGHAMICHATDPKAEQYGGKSASEGNERLCIGQLILIHRHLELLKVSASFKDYRSKAGKLPLTLGGGRAWASRILFGGLNGTLLAPAEVALPFESFANQPVCPS